MKLSDLPLFFRFKISLAVSLSALAGYFQAGKSPVPESTQIFFAVFYSDSFAGKAAILAGGIFLLAAGASGLNQIQEARLDKMMERTRSRPLPLQKISKKTAALLAAAAILGGLAFLSLAFDRTVLVLALFSFVLYNLIYTKLKGLTSFALIPGSLAGTMPFVIGWFGAGKTGIEPSLIAGAVFLFLWQVSHTFLLVLVFRPDYEKTRLPFGFLFFSKSQLERLIRIWYLNSILILGLFPLFGMIEFFPVLILLLFTGYFFLKFFTRGGTEKNSIGFQRHYNLFLIGVFAFLIWSAAAR